MYGTTELFRERFYGKKAPNGSWEHRPPDYESLLGHSFKMANSWVLRDHLLSGTLDCLQTIPQKHKVSKESGLDAEEELELSDSDIDHKPYMYCGIIL